MRAPFGFGPVGSSYAPPVIGYSLVVEVPDTGDQRLMAPSFGPQDRFMLCSERAEYNVPLIFGNIISDRAALRSALGARLNIDVCHSVYPWLCWC